MNVKNTTSISLNEALKTKGNTDWQRVDAVREQDLADDFDWNRAEFQAPKLKKPVSLRLDQDVVDFFKAYGKGYQTRINQVLKSYMQAQNSRS